MENNNNIQELECFNGVINDMELKAKEIFINNIKIKENLKDIKRIENKKSFLEDILSDKINELNILKYLIILKEQKKLNFDEIISKYLYQLICMNNRNNNKIDLLKRKNLIINEKYKIVNKLLDNFNNEFNNCLNVQTNNRKEKTKTKKYTTNDKKHYLSNVFSNGVNKYSYKASSSCNIKNKKNTNNLINDEEKKINLNDFIMKKGEIEELTNEFQNYINKNKENKSKNEYKKDNNEFINITPNNNLNKNANINIETFSLQNDRINFKANKNLEKSRENLKYLISQNDKEKINEKKSQIFNDFAKLVFLLIEKFYTNLTKIKFNQLKYYNAKSKAA